MFGLEIAIAVAMLIGMIGVVAPFIPGLTVIWLAALIYGYFAHFGTVGAVAFTIITIAYAIGMILGFVVPGKSAADAGAPASSIALGTLCACVGFFVIPVFGFIIGGVVGVLVGEYLRTNSTSVAWRTTVSTLIGFGISALVQLMFGLLMIGSWLAWVFFG